MGAGWYILVVNRQYCTDVDDEVLTARIIAPIVEPHSPTSVPAFEVPLPLLIDDLCSIPQFLHRIRQPDVFQITQHPANVAQIHL